MAKQRSTAGQIPVRKSPEALAMIHRERLEEIVAAAEAAARELCDSGIPIDRVDVERMTDPEIEDLELLGFTVWVPESAVGEASAAWRRLLNLVRARISHLGPEETHKLSELVSIGVDVE